MDSADHGGTNNQPSPGLEIVVVGPSTSTQPPSGQSQPGKAADASPGSKDQAEAGSITCQPGTPGPEGQSQGTQAQRGKKDSETKPSSSPSSSGHTSGSCLHIRNDPDETCLSLGSFVIGEACLTESSSDENGARQGRAASSANGTGTKNRNQSSVLEIQLSAASCVHSNTKATTTASHMDMPSDLPVSAASVTNASCNTQAYTASEISSNSPTSTASMTESPSYSQACIVSRTDISSSMKASTASLIDNSCNTHICAESRAEVTNSMKASPALVTDTSVKRQVCPASSAEVSNNVKASTVSKTDMSKNMPTSSVPHTDVSSSMQAATASQTDCQVSSHSQDLLTSVAGCSHVNQDTSASGEPSEHWLREDAGPGLEDLPKDVLMTLTHYLPTVSLLACAAVHPAFSDLLADVHFLNRETRRVLGFAANEYDITYDAVPPPVAPVQNLWYQTYLHQAAPYVVGLVTPGTAFYDLLCFKHLLDSWILQGLGYKYWMFVRDILRSKDPPPLDFIHCKRLMFVSPHLLSMLTKLALCHPEVLMQTLNNSHALTISGMPLRRVTDAWDLGVSAEYKLGFSPQDTCEVVSRQRGLTLASFFVACDSQSFVIWSGAIDYSTFRWKKTWGLCKIPRHSPLSVIRQQSQDVFPKFSEYVGQDYISVHCSEAFMFRGLCRLIQQGKSHVPQLQILLERKALKIHRKICRTLPSERRAEVKTFLDSVVFPNSGKSSLPSKVNQRLKQRGLSKTLEVALQRYLHRYLNQTIGHRVLELYRDPLCHHVLCISCYNARAVKSPPSVVCMEQVSCQRIPFKMWPSHLLQHGMMAIPALARLVCLDVELWKRGLLDQPLPPQVALFVRQVLGSVHLHLSLDSSEEGIIARRLFVQK